VVGYLVTIRAVETMLHAAPGSLAKLSIPVGLLSGVIAGVAYNRYSNITLPSYLSFFGGRRFVPIVSGVAGLLLAALVGYAWPFLERGMDATSQAILGAGSLGLFAYGVLNRILIVTGLHHILNNFAWFILGDYHGATGDLKRFFAGDPTAGAFMSGFFPVMMFGLPGACLAMYHTAEPKRRAGVAGLLLSLGLTSFLTGVTEPVEFTFMFLAPVLYALHAIATALRRAPRLQFFGGAIRLRSEFQPRTASVTAVADRRGVLRALLHGVSCVHRALESGDAGTRCGGCRSGAGRTPGRGQPRQGFRDGARRRRQPCGSGGMHHAPASGVERQHSDQ
jgi:hypothetical protein